jgi:hypothetical protein
MPKLLESVFCQSTVNYASAFDTVPLGLFSDGTAASLAALQAPIGVAASTDWTLLPVRAEVDKRIEVYLEKSNALRPDTVMAVRLLDDSHEVFSPKRCSLHASVTARLAGAAARVSVDDAVRAVVTESLDGDTTLDAVQKDYIRALVDPSTPPDVRDSTESAYISDLTARVAAETAKLQTDAGREELHQRWLERQAQARALYATAANPLPITN